ncbi:MAG TPA: hypothetical protein VME66_08935 [Candidatus Acidoferrales bacterium]|nr:hypothetical protein [Candidatus Acidoferrales bacterium]
MLLLATGIALADPTSAPPALPNFSLPAGSEPTLPPSVHLPKMPTTVLHTDFLVDTNRKGQVTRVRSGTGSSNARFNLMTYGNALQTFIRTPSGGAVAGIFRLDYDYSPTTGAVRRTVTLVRAGGVDPNAIGAVFAMLQDAHRHASPAPGRPAK